MRGTEPGRDPEFAIDAYLWAEQYAWIAYDDGTIKSTLFVDEHASFFMAYDLHWFSRLITAVAGAVRCFYRFDPSSATHEQRIQAWLNYFSDTEYVPKSWLEGTRFIARTKGVADPMPSIRVSAAKINAKRRKVFDLWRLCWEAELRHLDELVGDRSPRRT